MVKKLFGLLKGAALVIVVLVVLGVVVGGGSGDKEESAASPQQEESSVSQAESSEEEEAQGDDAEAEQPAQETDEGPKIAKNSKYEVTINGFQITEDYDGAPCIAIDYTFTNKSDDNATSMQLATDITVYQNGVECEDAWFSEGNSEDGYSNKVKAGVSVEVTRAYKLIDTSSDVEVEVAPLFSWGDDLLAYEVFQIA